MDNLIKIGKYSSNNNLFLAPMAGVTDQPFRHICKNLGAGWVVSEMVWSQKSLQNSKKTQQRINLKNEPSPKIVQVAGGDAFSLSESCKFNMDNGADIIDINMGCPAKKVCNKLAGSALMKNELLVAEILEAVVNSVNIPVTLKIRTGWDSDNINALKIAKIAEDSGIKSLAIHGRTRQQKYTGFAEYDTIALIKQNLKIPIIANGDIDSVEKALFVKNYTKADGLMIGRYAQGNPWIFREIQHFLDTKKHLPKPTFAEYKKLFIHHLLQLHSYYGEYAGLRIARKHIGWYFQNNQKLEYLKKPFNKLTSSSEQIIFLNYLQNVNN